MFYIMHNIASSLATVSACLCHARATNCFMILCITQVVAMDVIAKKATLDSGAIIVAPDFINEGDIIKVNTEDGTYAGRSS